MAYVLLDTFVIPKVYEVTTVSSTSSIASTENSNPILSTDAVDGEASSKSDLNSTGEVTITDTSYSDDHIQITIETVRVEDTTLYVADIQVDDASYLKTAFANDSYGRNIKEKTSEIASDHNAIFAINGDYYGFRDTGFVIRNGVLYRSTSENNEVLVIDENGDFSIADDTTITAETLLSEGAVQVFSFGPTLVNNGEVVVDENAEVSGKSMNSNPRTAIGQIDELHYIVIVSDGRTDASAGLSLYQIATEMQSRGATVAYNLDGGGSSTMVFNGQVVNETVGGRGSSEREVSDIVYFGYDEE